jgi:hypothetical protein
MLKSKIRQQREANAGVSDKDKSVFVTQGAGLIDNSVLEDDMPFRMSNAGRNRCSSMGWLDKSMM